MAKGQVRKNKEARNKGGQRGLENLEHLKNS